MKGTDLLVKFHVTSEVLHNTLLFNLKLGLKSDVHAVFGVIVAVSVPFLALNRTPVSLSRSVFPVVLVIEGHSQGF